MRKYLLNGLAALTMGLAMTSCMQEFNFEEQREKQILDNAEQTLGFHIPEGQDWVMSSEVTANISVNLTNGENYDIDILSNNPLMNDVAYVLASGEIANGGTFTSSFSLPADLKEVYLTITDSKGETIYRKAAIENGLINHSINNNANARTRSITVNGTTYEAFTYPTDDELTAAFPTSIPEGTEEVDKLESLYKGKTAQDQWGNTQTMWDLYAIYAYRITEGYNLKVTRTGVVVLGGSYQNSGWDNSAGKEMARPYNVYVDVDGDLTIRRNGATHFNLYIIRGNVTLESNYGEQAGSISVAAGATLNDQRNSIAANQGIKMYNRGTIKATNTEKYDIGNFSTVYNEGKFYISGPMTYSPGDANTSYFINMGDDAEITAPSMTMNSSCHFYNSGKVTVSGETNVTQKNIHWINNGHYETGSMIFSAGNATFYNYCQLLVKGNAHMYDGEFNLMENSYTEAATSEMDNFIVNMGDGASYYVKGDTKIEAQGDGTFQGFRNTNSGKGAVVKLGGTVTIASHKHSLMVDAGITYAINNVQIIKKGNVVTEDYLQSIGDGDYPVEVYDGVEANFDKTTVTANYLDCGGSTSVKPGEKTPSVWTYAFEDNTLKGDYDMNDVVLKVSYVDAKTMSQLKIELVAAGCEFDNEVYLDETPIMFANKRDGGETNEVHAAFGVAKGTLVNTDGRSTYADVVSTIIETPTNFKFQEADFNIVPSGGENKDQHICIAQKGAPYGIVVPVNWKYPVENTNIGNAYEEEGHSFGEWASDASHQTAADWYNYPTRNVVSK
jgi:hypothetical protein